jgi:hypothetical protein
MELVRSPKFHVPPETKLQPLTSEAIYKSHLGTAYFLIKVLVCTLEGPCGLEVQPAYYAPRPKGVTAVTGVPLRLDNAP